MNFLEGFNEVSNSGLDQAQRGQGPMMAISRSGPTQAQRGQGLMMGMIGQGGQGMPSPQGYNADWSGAPYGFNAQPWNTQPWTNPWASPQVGQQPMFNQQPMPNPTTAIGYPNMQPANPYLSGESSPYLSGKSSDIPEFDPKVPGGGMHEQQLAPAPPPPAAAPAPAPALAPAAPRYEMVRDPWYGKAGGEQQDDPLGGYSLQRKGNDYHWQDVPFIEQIRRQGLL